MTIYKSKTKENREGWHIICPLCKTKIELTECPVPGGFNNNIEECFECGIDIEVQP